VADEKASKDVSSLIQFMFPKGDPVGIEEMEKIEGIYWLP
jgi:hypothetical protein